MGCWVIVCALEEMCMSVENVVSLHRGLFYAVQCVFPFVIWFGRGATQSFQITALVYHCALCVPVAVNFNVKIMTLFCVTRVDKDTTLHEFLSLQALTLREKNGHASQIIQRLCEAHCHRMCIFQPISVGISAGTLSISRLSVGHWSPCYSSW